MFDYFINSWRTASILEAVQHLPKEVVYAAVAGLTANEIHKRHSNVKLEAIKVSAKTRELELEVEKLALQLDLHNAKVEKPTT